MTIKTKHMSKKVKYVCKHCGSDDLLHDAWAQWNEETQQMELAGVLDMTHCNECDGETTTKEVEI